MSFDPSSASIRPSTTGAAGCRRPLGTWVQGPVAVLAIVLALPAGAQSLSEVYDTAKAYDATYLSALSQFQASQAKAEQARAGLLPTVGVTAEAYSSELRSSYPALNGTSNNESLKLQASQPLFRMANSLTYEQAQRSLTAAQAQLQAAEQDLIVRTAQAYFDVLVAQENQSFTRAQKAAVAEQLAAAKRNFEVGTATITDTREAQARYDLVTAQEIASDNDLRVKRLALDQLIGKAGTQPWHLRSGTTLPAVVPDAVDSWTARAATEHPLVRQAETSLEVAQLETRKANAGHMPTVDAVAQYQRTHAPSGFPAIPGLAIPSYLSNNTATIGVQMNLPLFAGFAVQNRVKETLALEEKARTDLEAVKRSIDLATRAAFFGLQSGRSQVQALEAAEASSQSALEANQLGYQVGVRINIDVLNAQSQLYQTKAQLSKARYDVLVGGLKLRQASGVLQAADVLAVNDLLTR